MDTAQNSSNKWDIRQARAEDIPFIYDTWKNCYRYGSALGKSCRSSIFFDEYRHIIDSILDKSTTHIACKTDDPDVIFGYVVIEQNIIHFIFVKEDFRGFGIGRSLYATAKSPITETTHKTFHVERLIDTIGIDFNPFSLYRKDSHEY